MYKVNIASF